MSDQGTLPRFSYELLVKLRGSPYINTIRTDALYATQKDAIAAVCNYFPTAVWVRGKALLPPGETS